MMRRTCFRFTSIPLHFTSFHFTSLHSTSLPFIPLHFTSFHFTSLHFTSLHFTSLHSTLLHFHRFFCLDYSLSLPCVCVYELIPKLHTHAHTQRRAQTHMHMRVRKCCSDLILHLRTGARRALRAVDRPGPYCGHLPSFYWREVLQYPASTEYDEHDHENVRSGRMNKDS